MHRSAMVFVATLFCACGLYSQAAGPQQASTTQTAAPSTPSIRMNTEEVTLDMVFKDKKGKAIQDVRPEEVHVFEDGVEQHLTTFKYLEGAKNAPAPATTAPTTGAIPLDPMRDLRLVTLVFENLGPEERRFFHQALEDMFKIAPEQNLYFSVMVVDEKLHMIQPFTNDRALLMKTVEKSATWQFIQFQQNSAAVKAELARTLSNGEPGSQSSVSGDASNAPTLTGASPTSGPSQTSIDAMVNYRMAKMQYDMLQQADSANRQADARGTIDALLALVRAESQLPGRKVVVYFNPWLFIPDVAKEQYAYMVSAANRANITFYTVDPKGLVTYSQGGSGVDQLGGGAGESRNAQLNGGRGQVETSQARALESAENGIRSNPLLWLRDLSDQTGGLTIGETNDLRAPLRTVMDEVRSYYEASYDPHISVFDGKFRKISVRMDRPGIEVHTRSGYFALPQLGGGQQLLAYEVPLMNAISAAQPLTDLAFSASAERFNERGPKIEYMLTLEVPLKELTFAPQPDGKTAVFDAPITILVRNSAGDVVDKFSKDFSMSVAQDTVEARKAHNLVQTYRTELAPGTYTLEAAVMDRKGTKIGVKKSPLVVPDPTNKLAISDVVVVLRTDQIKDTPILDPFYLPGGKVTPTLSSTLKGGAGSILPFYFTVYPDAAMKDAPNLTMGFYKDGQYLGSAEAPLPPVGKDGRIPYIANLPADKFTPGSYEIRLSVKQGADDAEQKVDFQVD